MKIFLIAVLALFQIAIGVKAVNSAIIYYTSNNLSGNTWEYQYIVHDDTLVSDIEEFSIFFDPGVYENLTLPVAPGGWDAIVIQPDLGLPDDGFYDALALVSGIDPGGSLSGFSVRFDYLGSGIPGAQFFQIIDPYTFEPLDEGSTRMVPSPATILLMIPALLGLVAVTRLKMHRTTVVGIRRQDDLRTNRS